MALRISYSQRAALRVMMLSACAESMIVSVPPAESMILLAPFEQKKTIGDYDDRRCTTIVNSASTGVPIGLPRKMAKFCHTSDRFLVARGCRRALLRLYFNSSATSQLVGNKGCRALGGSLQKDKGCRSITSQKRRTKHLGVYRSLKVLFAMFTNCSIQQ